MNICENGVNLSRIQYWLDKVILENTIFQLRIHFIYTFLWLDIIKIKFCCQTIELGSSNKKQIIDLCNMFITVVNPCVAACFSGSYSWPALSWVFSSSRSPQRSVALTFTIERPSNRQNFLVLFTLSYKQRLKRVYTCIEVFLSASLSGVGLLVWRWFEHILYLKFVD